jgi:hypothetical protein
VDTFIVLVTDISSLVQIVEMRIITHSVRKNVREKLMQKMHFVINDIRFWRRRAKSSKYEVPSIKTEQTITNNCQKLKLGIETSNSNH